MIKINLNYFSYNVESIKFVKKQKQNSIIFSIVKMISSMRPCDACVANVRTWTTNNQQRKVKTIAVTHPVFSRFDLFDPRRDVLWRSGPGSVSGTRTCCSSDRACACWLPVGWLGRPWQPVSVWWECWQELPFSPPLTLGRGVSLFPSSPLLVCLLRRFQMKIGKNK